MISLNGQFKADIYNQNDELVSEGEYAGNFITSTGLNYPLTMPFADAFKYLSLGSGKAPNHLYTTGLHSGCVPHIYSSAGTYPAQQNFLWTTGIVPSACGYKSTTSGVDLYRGWRIPEQDGSFLKEDLHVAEMMTTPATTGEPKKVERSNHFIDPFSGTTAFSRVLKDFTIPSGDYAVITYKLNFVIDSEVKTFDPFIGLNNAAGASKTAWQALTGQSRVLHHGIRLVKGGDGGGGGGQNEPVGGDTYELDYGSPLEPYATGNMYAYFSSDNTQFRFDPFWGGAAKPNLQKLVDSSNGTLHWNTTGINIATGMPEYFWNLPEVIEDEDTQSVNQAKSLHDLHSNPARFDYFKKFRRVGSTIPKSTEFNNEFEASSMSNAGFNSNNIVTSLNHDIATDYTGQIDYRRDRSITRVLGWQAINAVADPGNPGTYINYKSLVFCAEKGDSKKETITELNNKHIPFFDSQFGTYDSTNHPAGGEHIVNITSTGLQVYDSTNQYPTFAQPADDYPYQDNQNGLSITWKLGWSSPCAEVNGHCSNDPLITTKAACEMGGGTWTACVDP